MRGLVQSRLVYRALGNVRENIGQKWELAPTTSRHCSSELATESNSEEISENSPLEEEKAIPVNPLLQHLAPVIKPPEYPGETEEMRDYRMKNISMYGLEGQIVSGTVVAVGPDYVMVDLGLEECKKFFKHEVSTTQIYTPAKDHKLKRKEGAFFVGDEMRFKIDSVDNPYGEIQFVAQKLQSEMRHELAWKEIYEAYLNKNLVMGRVLNMVNRGYAVGIGGFVAFCPLSSMGSETANKVGVLQPFTIASLDMDRKSLVVMDAHRPSLVNKSMWAKKKLFSSPGSGKGWGPYDL